VLLSEQELERIADLCAAAGSWLVLDNTYEDFVYGPSRSHHSVRKANVVNIFSFSKAYGMMGWRIGYIAYPGQELLKQAGLGSLKLGDQLMKVSQCCCHCICCSCCCSCCYFCCCCQ
jgi:aspartate/methionine/tyrosine aminotransferase